MRGKIPHTLLSTLLAVGLLAACSSESEDACKKACDKIKSCNPATLCTISGTGCVGAAKTYADCINAAECNKLGECLFKVGDGGGTDILPGKLDTGGPGGACKSETCATTCPTGNCETCVSKGTCSSTCEGASCTQGCFGDGNCTFTCNGSTCKQTCGGNATCVLTCNGSGCTQSCENAAKCTMNCPGGGCTQTCKGTGTCAKSCIPGNCT